MLVYWSNILANKKKLMTNKLIEYRFLIRIKKKKLAI